MTAVALRALQVPGSPVVLPNAWDASSARAVRDKGFPAVATSSAAVAGALGYADGEATPVAEMMAAVARIAGAVDIPVTADVERGYRLVPAELVERLAEAGAVGCNLEDSDPATKRLIELEEQADFLAAVRSAALHSGVDLVINARVDTFARGHERAVEEGLRRAQRYLAAGADCVYPITAADPDDIRAMVEGAGGPVNILYRPGAPSLAALAELGVARISFGSGLHRATVAHLEQLLTGIASGTDPY